MKKSINYLVKSAVIAAIYTIITILFSFMGYQAIQFRISEIMVLLVFIDSKYTAGLILGCFIANLLGPYGLIDAVFGSLASLFAIGMIIFTRKKLGFNHRSLFISSFWPAISSFIIAFEIVFVFNVPESYWLWVLWVAIGEFVVVTLAGVPIFRWIMKQDALVQRLKI